MFFILMRFCFSTPISLGRLMSCILFILVHWRVEEDLKLVANWVRGGKAWARRGSDRNFGTFRFGFGYLIIGTTHFISLRALFLFFFFPFLQHLYGPKGWWVELLVPDGVAWDGGIGWCLDWWVMS
ncbi:hypothetical protein OCU04_005820 [Sclerotinia nivalis]|uniref:Transmembrane protein n=1 Tax=Sclerotinia nivalis TaxID=352851 RepID=A0A9X0ALQ7_9HELO|nr:hypothetical protein OCU04_005820 [Sclerotinia nivalis]